MLRLALFSIVISGGSLILKNLDLLDGKTAWLVCGVVASLLMFLLPPPGHRRHLKHLFLYLLSVLATYAISFNVHPWLTLQIGGPVASVVTVLLFIVLIGAFILLSPKRFNIKTNTAL